ncbi:MAG TPA: hypothetical protein VF339_04770 [Gammaproteobacteria bacterium]
MRPETRSIGGAAYTARMRLRTFAIAALAIVLSGCATYQPIETTPEGIAGHVAPGDSVRVITRDENELRFLVTYVDDAEISGRVDGDGAPVRLSFDAIRRIEIHRFSMRRTLLGVVLPVVVGALVVCNNDDCRTESVVDADL